MKKMRKLIPAFAMLMVAAIMMTTASFAWFTMNEQVTATGMQIKAQASGSLVISDSPLQYTDADPSVNFNTAIQSLIPVTLVVEEDEDNAGEYKGVWKSLISGDENTPASVVNPNLGTPDYRGLVSTNTRYYYEKEIYVGTSGVTDLTDGSITMALGAVASTAGTATNAYAVAVYVVGVTTATKNTDNEWVDGLDSVDFNAVPDMILRVESSKKELNIDLEDLQVEGLYIPSILGYGENGNENATGLKVVLRFFVDGALTTTGTDKRPVNTGAYNYENATTALGSNAYNPQVTYWYDTNTYADVTMDAMLNAPAGVAPSGWFIATTDGDSTVYTAIAKGTSIATTLEGLSANQKLVEKVYKQGTEGQLENNGTTIPSSWLVRTAETESFNYHYVNNKDIPSSGSSLSVTFKHVPANG